MGNEIPSLRFLDLSLNGSELLNGVCSVENINDKNASLVGSECEMVQQRSALHHGMAERALLCAPNWKLLCKMLEIKQRFKKLL